MMSGRAKMCKSILFTSLTQSTPPGTGTFEEHIGKAHPRCLIDLSLELFH